MTPLNFAIVGLRLLAIYFFFQAGSTMTYAGLFLEFSNQIPGHSPIASLLAFFPCGVLLLIAAILFFYAEPLSRRLAPPVVDESKKLVFSFEELHAIIFAAVGILILSNALPTAGRALQTWYSWYYSQQDGGATYPLQVRDTLMYDAGVLAQIVIGLLLVLNSKGFSKIWRWLRTAGTPPVE